MSMRALIVCPGRGSYDRAGMGQLQDRSEAARAVISACDQHREGASRPSVSALDGAEKWRSSLHVAGENASLLTAACSLADMAELARDRFEVVGVTGNSMGWYTALGVSGALSLSDTIRVIDTMGAYQAKNVIGGQVLYPLTNASWASDPDLLDAVERTLVDGRNAGHALHWSIHLGGYAVLAGDRAGVKFLLENLPEQQRGSRTFPIQLPMHSAFHTPLMREASNRAKQDLADLGLSAPDVPLIDGRGKVFRPLSADPAELFDYTLGAQVTDPYDFTTAVASALRYTGADVVIALGPGNSLGGPIARILVEQGWRGARSRDQFDEIQKSESPLLLSFGVRPQRKRLV